MQPRVRLSDFSEPFRSSPDRVARVTLAWFDADGPVLVGVAPIRTAVVVWPTDEQGYVRTDGVRAGGAQVRVWELSATEAARLHELENSGWNLLQHDLLVSGDSTQPKLHPTQETLRGSSWDPTPSAEQLARLIGSVSAERTNADSRGANRVRTGPVRTAGASS
jgi:hypothetical protein